MQSAPRRTSLHFGIITSLHPPKRHRLIYLCSGNVSRALYPSLWLDLPSSAEAQIPIDDPCSFVRRRVRLDSAERAEVVVVLNADLTRDVCSSTHKGLTAPWLGLKCDVWFSVKSIAEYANDCLCQSSNVFSMLEAASKACAHDMRARIRWPWEWHRSVVYTTLLRQSARIGVTC